MNPCSREEEIDPIPICPVTGSYCSGRFCDEYGCAKEAEVWDEDEEDYL